MNRILSYFVTLFILNGCASIASIPSIPDIVPQISLPTLNNPAPPAGKDIERANAFFKAGKRRDAASAYFSAADNYPSPQRERLILQAAELASLFKDNNLAQRYLSPISSAVAFNSLDSENKTRFRLVQGQLALNDKNYHEALRIIPQRVNNLPKGLASKILSTRMNAVQASGDKLSLVQELVLQESQLQDDYRIKLNHDRIWGHIKQMPMKQINEGKKSINHIVLREWLNLGALSRAPRVTVEQEARYKNGIENWIKKNPTHPGITKTIVLLRAKPTTIVTPYLGGVKPAPHTHKK